MAFFVHCERKAEQKVPDAVAVRVVNKVALVLPQFVLNLLREAVDVGIEVVSPLVPARRKIALHPVTRCQGERSFEIFASVRWWMRWSSARVHSVLTFRPFGRLASWRLPAATRW
jgi:hypothetical protein